MNKQKATQDRKDKNQARADELAKGRQARADAKAAALAQAAIDRKEKQEGIAQRIEVGFEFSFAHVRDGGDGCCVKRIWSGGVAT